MPSRRSAITMTEDEIVEFLAAGRVATVATVGPHGRPHLVPLWYSPAGTTLATWTFARAQKAVNLRRDQRLTALVESGEQYSELRGVSMECDVELVRDTERVAEIGRSLLGRYGGGATPEGTTVDDVVAAQAAKRLGIVARPTKIVSWDHRKLGGVY
jgi:PPOX class probable F420-dependent enzyme